MIESLIIRLIDSENGLHVEWALRREDWKLAGSTHAIPIEALGRAVPAASKITRETIVLLPAAWVLLSRVIVPEKQRRHLQQVLPFLLEEQLAEDVAQLHVAALGIAPAGEPQPVAVIRSALLRTSLNALRAAGITPHVVLPETLALPYREGEWNMLWGSDAVWIRRGRHSGICVDTATLPTIVSLLLQTESLPTAIVGILSTEADAAAAEQALVAIQHQAPLIPLRGEQSGKTVFEWMGDHVIATRADHSANTLLQGEFASAGFRQRSATPWRRIAMIAAVWFVAQTLFIAGQTLYFSLQAREAQAAITAQYRALFPDDRKIIDPIRQMKAHMVGSSAVSQGDFLPRLGKVAQAWGQMRDVEIQTITYRSADDPLVFSLTAASLEAMNAGVQQLTAAGLNATLTSLSTTSTLVTGQLKIEEPRP